MTYRDYGQDHHVEPRTADFYAAGLSDAHAGLQPSREHLTKLNYMYGWNAGRETYQRYRDLIEEGYSRYEAAVMSGMRDPDEAA